MDIKLILDAVKKLREGSKKRKFKQSFDLIINLKELNLKKPDENVNQFIVLKHNKGRKAKVCGFIDKELFAQKGALDKAVARDDFSKLSKSDIKKVVNDYDFFIAQATLMTYVAKFFGKYLGPRGKMPNPKAGCIVTPNSDIKALHDQLQLTVKLETKNELIVKCSVGSEDMSDNDVAENVLAVYDRLLHMLPQEKVNIKNAMLKLTMSKPVLIGENEQKSIGKKAERS